MKANFNLTKVFCIAVLALTTACSSIQTRETASSAPSSTAPTPRTQQFSWMSMSTWYQKHAEDIQATEKGDIDVIFLGDSITDGWNGEIWSKEIAPLNAVNFGIGGDLTQNVLWRLNNGTIGKLDPKVVSILIGVNNLGHYESTTPMDVFLGVEAIVNKTLISFPNAQIILQAVFPYGQNAQDINRVRVKDSNKLVASLAQNLRVDFYDFGALFLAENGDISKSIMSDFLHPTAAGYRIYADALLPKIKASLAKK